MTTHTIKVSLSEAVQVRADGEKVNVSALLLGVSVGSRSVDLATVGAVIFALEQAAEQAEQARMLAAAQRRAA